MQDNLRVKRRRIYYLPGLLSLVLLPIAVYFFVNKKQLLKGNNVIEINAYNPQNAERYPELYPQIFPPKRKYSEIYLSGDDQNDRIKLDFAQLEIRDLVATSDTTRGIILNFTDKTKYWTLVRAINICNIEKCGTFAFYNNQIFIFNKPPVKESAVKGIIFKSFCGTNMMNCIPENIESTITFKDRIKFMTKQLKNYYLLVALFLIMVILTIIKAIRFKTVYFH